MTPASRIPMATLLLAAVLAMPWPASAQFNLLFGGRGGKDFSAEDWSIFKEAMRRLLEDGKAGSRADWRNDDTGFHGDMRVESAYQRDGLPCRHVAFTVVNPNGRVPYQMNFCKTDAGNWVIAP